MTVVQALRIQEIYIIALLLLLLLQLLPLPLLHASPYPTTAVNEFVVATTSDAESLAEALLSDGPGTFAVTWQGDVMLSRTLSVSNGSTLNVTGSSGSSSSSTDGGAVVNGDGTVLLFEADLGSTVWLTGLTLSGGDGALRVAGESFAGVVDCGFMDNDRSSSEETEGGAISAEGSKVVLKGETLFANNTAYNGGAIHLMNSSELSLLEGGSASFFNNRAGNYGGAINADGSNVVLKGGAIFANNTAEYGGAIHSVESSELNISEGGSVYFLNNHADEYGGAIRVYVQSLFNSYGTASFVSNEAIYGGAVHIDESNAVFEGETLFENNTASVGGAIRLKAQSTLNSYGTASFVSNEAESGGAISFGDSEVNFFGNFSFEGNHANGTGGAIDLDDGSIVHIGGTASFVGNGAADRGGAINAVGSNVVLKGETIFANNTAEYGGAIHSVDSSELNISEGANVNFSNNHADGYGGAIRVYIQSLFSSYGTASFVSNEAIYGGAVHVDDSNAVLEGETLFANNRGDFGGAIRLKAQSVLNSSGTTSYVSNQAGSSGGAISFEYSEVNFIGNASFEDNYANASGGAVHLDKESILLVDGTTSFAGNEATNNGGAIYVSDSSVSVETATLFEFNVASTGSGGGVYASSSVVALTGAVFTENRGAWGGGVAFFSSGSILGEETDGFTSSKITGCHFEGNTATDGGAVYTAAGYDEVVKSSFTRNFAAVQGGALLHSGVLVALTECTFESNTAGEDGLAVMSLGMINNITALTFRNNSFFCASGKYGFEKDIDEVEDPDTCHWGVVCSRCTDHCGAPPGIDMDETTVPVCEVVPDGVDTTGNSGMKLETLNLLSGFYRTSNNSIEILECYREEACKGGSNTGRYCAEGYAGPYCAVCDKGYGSGFQYSCHSCQGSKTWTAVGGAVAVLVVVMVVATLVVGYLVAVVDRPTSVRSGRWERWERRVSSFRDRLLRAIPLTAVKIVLVFWQIITQFSGVVSVQYPPAYESFLAALTVVDLNLGDILSVSCVVETNFYARLILVTIAPVAVLGALVITYRVAMLRNGHSNHAKRVARNKHLSAGLFLLFIVYSSVSYTIFQTFVCDPLDSGVQYLRADYGLICWTRTHYGLMTYAGFMILVYPVGIPVVFAWALFRNRDGIKSLVGTTDKSRVPPELGAIQDLWAPYKRSRYYYEVIECGRRIALTGLAVFIYPGSTAQVAIEALLAVVFSSISEILSPFAEPLDAWLYRCGTWVIFLSMYLALLLKMDATDEDSGSQNAFAGILITAHVGMVLVVIANVILSSWKGLREVRAVEVPVVIQEPKAAVNIA